MDDKGVNACKHKAMSYERMNAEPQAESKAAEAADAEEDKLYGDRRGDEMPDWVAAQAEEIRRREEAEKQRKKKRRKTIGKASATPRQMARRSATSPIRRAVS
jgi:hypothetical protein